MIFPLPKFQSHTKFTTGINYKLTFGVIVWQFLNRFRITEEKEYVKVITAVFRVHGAVLIGDTDLEEVIENLILNQTDISQIEDNLLDPSVNF